MKSAIQYKMARDRRLLLVMYADKLACRKFVAERVGTGILTELYGAGSTTAEVRWDRLPREFVAKVNHGSGGVVVVSDVAEPSVTLPPAGSNPGWMRYVVRPEALVRADLIALLDHWLSLRYRQGAFERYEWVYGQVTPHVFVEQCVAANGGLPAQLRFFCFDGIVGEVLVEDLDTGSFAARMHTRRFVEEFDEVRRELRLSPDTWHEVIRASAALAREADMIRVDWLVADGKVWFSELTNYPAGGDIAVDLNPSVPAHEVDRRMRAMWVLPPDYAALDSETRPMAARLLDHGSGYL